MYTNILNKYWIIIGNFNFSIIQLTLFQYFPLNVSIYVNKALPILMQNWLEEGIKKT